METRKLASDDSEKAANNADNHRFCSAGFLAKAVHFIKKLILVIMAAVPTPEGIVYWAGKVISSRDHAEIILAFSTSPEYPKIKGFDDRGLINFSL